MKCFLGCFPVVKRVSLTSAGLSLLVATVAVSLLFGSTALASPIAAEYFDYGTTTRNLPNITPVVAADWNGFWSGFGDQAMADYSSTNLNLDSKYTSAQYDNSANVGGMAGFFGNTGTNSITYRDFTTAQTGTIWISAILKYTNNPTPNKNENIMLRLKQAEPDGTADGVGIYNDKASLMYRTGGTENFLGTQALNSDVYLLLVKIDMNYSGTLDRVTMWIDPNLSSGEAGLGAGTLMQENKNALGSSLLGVGISVSGDTGEGLDAIRVGTTLADVTDAGVAPDTTPPAGIEDLAVSAVATTSITLQWTAPGDDGLTGRATNYDVRYHRSPITDGNWADTSVAAGAPAPLDPGTVQTLTVTGLTPGTTYHFAVKTADEASNDSSLSNVVSGQTDTDEIAPAAVDTLAAGNPTASSIALTWTAPGDDASSGTAASYDIRYFTSTINAGNWDGATQVSGEPTPAAAGTVQGMTVTGLTADTVYYFAMKTADEVSNVSALSNSASDRTPEPGGTLQVTPATLTFSGQAGTANPAPQDATVQNTGAGTIHWTAAVRAPAPAWVSLTNPTGTGNGSFTVNVDWQSLPAGPHTAYVDVTDPQATNSPQTVTVVCDLNSGQQVVALKRDAGLTAGGAIDSRFNSATVVTTTVSDTGIHAGGWTRWQNFGSAAVPGQSHNLLKFGLSSIPAGSRINLAQLRLYHSGGNSTYGNAPIGMVLTHDWIEGTRSGTYPGAAGGASFAHPIGYNTSIDQNASGGTTPPLQSWGPTSNSFFSLSGDVGPLKEPAATAGYHVYDLTAHVQGWVNGTLPNYGWAHSQGLWTFHMSEAGSANQPVLFIDYMPASGSPDTTAPAAVANLGHSLMSSSWVTITWQAPGDDGGTGTAYYYDLRYSTSPINEGNWADATQIIGEPAPAAAGASQSNFVENVTPGITYYFAIKTYDELWNPSPLSNIHPVAMPAGTPAPAAITDLHCNLQRGTHVKLGWTAPGADYQSGGPAAAYDLRYSTSPITEDNWGSATPYTYGVPLPASPGTLQEHIPVYYLNPGTPYYFAIKTRDAENNWSPLSKAFSQATYGSGDSAPPAIVGNLAASNPTTNAVTLSWNASGDDMILGPCHHYDIRYSTSPITEDSWWWTATKVTGEPPPQAAGSPETMTVNGLSSGRTYYFAIRAVDDEMNSSGMAFAQADIQAATDSTAPAAINLALATGATAFESSGTVRLTWTATGDDNASGTATTYDIRYSTSTIAEGNWASAQQASGELAPQVAGTTETWTVQGLSANTTYYFAIKAIDEAGNPSALSNVVSKTTLTASDLNKPVLTEQDFEYLGAFKIPPLVYGLTTSSVSGGIAVRRVGGNLRLLSEYSACKSSAIWEYSFPGWGMTSETWPEATPLYDWGTAPYTLSGSSISMLEESMSGTDQTPFLEGLNYDAVTGRFYFSWGPHYNASNQNFDSLGWAELPEGGPAVAHGPWHGRNDQAHPETLANNHRIRGGSTIIPDWFADAYVGGRRLGLGFNGAYSITSNGGQGPYLAAATPPTDPGELSTITLLDHPGTHPARRDADYWYTTTDPDRWNPIGGVGQWTMTDEIGGAGIWIDLPDKHGVVLMPAMGHGHHCYIPGGFYNERVDIHRLIYDPKDLAAVALGTKQRWEPEHQDAIVPMTPHVNFNPLGGRASIIGGLAFDPQTRTLFAIVLPGYKIGDQAFPLVHGWRIKESPLPLLPGDINKDGYVNVGDLQALVAAWGSQGTPPSGNWNAAADINTDDYVNVGDLQLLVAHWGEHQ